MIDKSAGWLHSRLLHALLTKGVVSVWSEDHSRGKELRENKQIQIYIPVTSIFSLLFLLFANYQLSGLYIRVQALLALREIYESEYMLFIHGIMMFLS